MTQDAVAPDAVTAASADDGAPVAVRRAIAVRAVVGCAVFWLAYDGGSFAVAQWALAAIVVWWAVAAGIAMGVWPVRRIPPGAAAVAALAALFAAYTGLSGLWAGGGETPFYAMARVLFYAGVLLLPLVAAVPSDLGRWSDGVALAIVAVAAVAFVSRLAPGHFDIAASLILDAQTRLSYPVGYWNGLAVLVALGYPLLLRAAVAASSLPLRGLPLLPLPMMAAVVYLASSRNGALTIMVALIAFVATARRRLLAAAAAATAAAASVAGAAVVAAQPRLVDGPLTSSTALAEGRLAALAVVAIGLAAAVVYAVASGPLESARVPRSIGWAAVAVAVAVAVGAVALSHPLRRWHHFTQQPRTIATQGYTQGHFLSTNGNLRWQYWKSAVDEFRTRPLIGRGSGSFESWWSVHGNVVGFIGNAHSLYFETLAELGVIGLALLASALLGGIAVAVRSVRRVRDGDGDAAQAATAAVIAFVVAIGVDWVWDVPAVGATGMLLLGIALAGSLRSGAVLRRRRGRLALAGLAAVVILVQADAYAADAMVRASQSAAGSGDFPSASADAGWARRLQPWAATPYLQSALVDELRNQLDPAAAAIRQAIDRDPNDWRLWFVDARIALKRGDRAEAATSLDRARRLNPRSTLLRGPGG